jgi:hypothetical protein
MQIPSPSHPAWMKVISGETAPAVDFLAIRILLSRLNLMYRKDSSITNTQNSVNELRTFFEKNINLPKVQSDLSKIIGEGV